MLFSFVSITYNHQDFIYQHLESIKYQILNYGDEFEFELIICDDASTDSTVYHINRWLSEHASLFKSVKVETELKNQGIVLSFIKALSLFNGDYLKILAGDDLFSCSNLFECIKLLSEWDIVQGALFEFKGDEIMRDTEYFRYIVNFRPASVRKFHKHSQNGQFCFRAPGVIFRKELITRELISFIKNYKMCEDMPFFYGLLSIKNIKICFYPTPIVLYRISSNSIARNFTHPAKQILIEDNKKFFNYLASQTGNVFNKLYMKHYVLNISRSNRKYLYKINPLLIYRKIELKLTQYLFRSYVKLYYESVEPLIDQNERNIKSFKGYES